MALLCRVKELKLKPNIIINQFKRYYFQIHTPRLSSNHTSPNSISDYYYRFVNMPKNQGFIDSRVRFFAAPVQFLKKVEEKQLNRPRLNDEIKNVDSVRLVTNEGHSVVSIWEARRRAKELDFDLVEVDKQSNPPVCRLMDYKKEMYNRKVKGKEKAKIRSAQSVKSASKEVRFSTKAELKDLKTKADGVKRLMEKGYRVKCTAALDPKGGGGDLRALLSQISTLIEDVAIVESEPKINEKEGHIIVRHVKFGKPRTRNKAFKGLKPTDSENQSESHDEESDADLNDEVKRPLQGQGPTSRAPTFVPNVGPTSRAPNFVPNVGPASRAPNFGPNVGPAPQLENRYAKKVPNNSAPARSPSSGTLPHPQSHRFPPVGPRQVGRQANVNPPTSKSDGYAAGDNKKW